MRAGTLYYGKWAGASESCATRTVAEYARSGPGSGPARCRSGQGPWRSMFRVGSEGSEHAEPPEGPCCSASVDPSR